VLDPNIISSAFSISLIPVTPIHELSRIVSGGDFRRNASYLAAPPRRTVFAQLTNPHRKPDWFAFIKACSAFMLSLALRCHPSPRLGAVQSIFFISGFLLKTVTERTMISLEEARDLMELEVETDALRKHMLTVSVIMEALAAKLGIEEDEAKGKWALVGLLHDLDYERTKGDFELHGLITAEMLDGKLPEDCLEAIKAHNKMTGFEPASMMAKALIAADAVSGLIVPTALMMPSRKLADVRVKSLTKKYKDKSFARTVSREKIMICADLGLERSEFFTLALEALQKISDELGV
jgi:putative nucleotidyltransferase with HDIG domain